MTDVKNISDKVHTGSDEENIKKYLASMCDSTYENNCNFNYSRVYFKCVGNNNGFKYKKGLNFDHLRFKPWGVCEEGGLYFTDLENIHYFHQKTYGYTVAILRIPEGVPVYKDKNKWKAPIVNIIKFVDVYKFNRMIYNNVMKGKLPKCNVFNKIRVSFSDIINQAQSDPLVVRYLREFDMNFWLDNFHNYRDKEWFCNMKIPNKFVNDDFLLICKKLNITNVGKYVNWYGLSEEMCLKIIKHDDGSSVYHMFKNMITEKIIRRFSYTSNSFEYIPAYNLNKRVYKTMIIIHNRCPFVMPIPILKEIQYDIARSYIHGLILWNKNVISPKLKNAMLRSDTLFEKEKNTEYSIIKKYRQENPNEHYLNDNEYQDLINKIEEEETTKQ